MPQREVPLRHVAAREEAARGVGNAVVNKTSANQLAYSTTPSANGGQLVAVEGVADSFHGDVMGRYRQEPPALPVREARQRPVDAGRPRNSR